MIRKPGPDPLVSILIPSWNRKKDLEETLDGVFAQDYPSLEVIVVDNGSEDETLRFLKAYPRPLELILNPANRGASHARNQGILRSRGKYLLFMDSDASILDSGAVTRMVARMEGDPSLGALSAPIYHNRECTVPWIWGLYFFDDYYTDWSRAHTEMDNTESCTTCFVMVRREAAVATGGFDPVYFYQHEDLDFFLRYRKQTGLRLDLQQDVRIWHRSSFEGRKMDRWFWMHFREEWKHQYLVMKNLGVLRSARYILRNLFDSRTLRAYYVRPIRRRKFIALFMVLPLGMLLISPWIVRQRYRNPLRELERNP